MIDVRQQDLKEIARLWLSLPPGPSQKKTIIMDTLNVLNLGPHFRSEIGRLAIERRTQEIFNHGNTSVFIDTKV